MAETRPYREGEASRFSRMASLLRGSLKATLWGL